MKPIQPKPRGKDEISARFANEEEFNKYANGLVDKFESGIELSLQEQIDLCRFAKADLKALLPFCDDETFMEDFRDFIHNKYRKKSTSMLSRVRMNRYSTQFSIKVYDGSIGSTPWHFIAKEVRDSLKQLKRSVPANNWPECETETLLYSRYMSIVIHRILSELPDEHKELVLDGTVIHIDAHTLSHSLIRHYGPMIYKFRESKSYFDTDVAFDQIHEHLEYILNALHKAGFKFHGATGIKVEYKGKPFQIYFRDVGKSSKEKGTFTVKRVNSFYPIEDKTELSNLQKAKKSKITDDLSIYEDS